MFSSNKDKSLMTLYLNFYSTVQFTKMIIHFSNIAFCFIAFPKIIAL